MFVNIASFFVTFRVRGKMDSPVTLPSVTYPQSFPNTDYHIYFTWYPYFTQLRFFSAILDQTL